MPADPEVRAAGGVVWRRAGGGPEIAVVHRPRYDDWSLPKGKLDAGESFEQAALREVEEETGLRCTLGAFLGETSYRDRKGREKVVRYWAMEAADGDFDPDDEVDEVRWATPAAAAEILTYGFDRELVQRAADGLRG